MIEHSIRNTIKDWYDIFKEFLTNLKDAETLLFP